MRETSSRTLVAMGTLAFALLSGEPARAQRNDNLQAQVPGAVAPVLQPLAPATAPPPQHPALFSSPLAQAASAYKANPSAAAFAEVLRILKAMLATPPGQGAAAASIIKDNPALADLGVRVLDAQGGRVWVFSRTPHGNDVLVEWQEVRAQPYQAGRRTRISHTTTTRLDVLSLPQSVSVKETRLVGSAPGGRLLIISGQDKAKLFLRAYRLADGRWHEDSEHLASIPSWLTENVSGKVSFRGPDLVFSVARIPPTELAPGSTELPETESATYKFWLRFMDGRYVLQPRLTAEEPYTAVAGFLKAVMDGQVDSAASFLLDAKLSSIPKYLGLVGKRPAEPFKVIEMAVPSPGTIRYRVVTFDKDDLIFDVAKIKDRMMIKAIFIAAQDPYLRQIKQHLADWDKVSPQPATQL